MFNKVFKLSAIVLMSVALLVSVLAFMPGRDVKAATTMTYEEALKKYGKPNGCYGYCGSYAWGGCSFPKLTLSLGYWGWGLDYLNCGKVCQPCVSIPAYPCNPCGGFVRPMPKPAPAPAPAPSKPTISFPYYGYGYGWGCHNCQTTSAPNSSMTFPYVSYMKP